MDNEERIKNLEENQKEIVGVQKSIIKILERIVIIKEKFDLKFKEIYKFMAITALDILLILIVVKIEAVEWLGQRVYNFWHSLSENWQIFALGALWTLFVAIFVLFIDRKYFNKPIDSKTSQNRKDSNIDKK